MSSQEYYQGQHQQGGYPQHPQQSYGPPQGQYPPPQGQYYGPPQGQQPMQYQQAPPPQDTRGKKGGSNNCLIACLAAICCCCAVEEGCECCPTRACCQELVLRSRNHGLAPSLTNCAAAISHPPAAFLHIQ
ncbi:hypothetical protein E4U43_008090 [Claviceps pusilla]|uniref:Cysteine-rich transmembrane domain-containing protein n=1 Tax=Claviceps pusilla TaxID=123648 RepID=A0A9P7T114_9HYPO|nr:hypothetical protein E4U43_008090 [Claviceps pusilla]